MDYINAEEKLLAEQLRICEKLSHMETVKGNIKVPESLSKNGKLQMPLKIRGAFLGVGRPARKYYTAEELRKSVLGFKVIPLKLDHKDKLAGATVGAITKIYWDEAEQKVRYEGHINSETHARNVLDRVTTDVSATIFSSEAHDERFGLIGTDLEYAEISLVHKGAYSGNTLEVA